MMTVFCNVWAPTLTVVGHVQSIRATTSAFEVERGFIGTSLVLPRSRRRLESTAAFVIRCFVVELLGLGRLVSPVAPFSRFLPDASHFL